MVRASTILLLCGVAMLASCASPCPDARCSSRPLSHGIVQQPEVDAGAPAPDAAIADETEPVPMEFSDWVIARPGDDDQWIRVGTFGERPEVSVDFMQTTQAWRVTNTGAWPADYACEVKYTCESGEEPTDKGAAVLAPGDVGEASAVARCDGRAQTVHARCRVNDPPE